MIKLFGQTDKSFSSNGDAIDTRTGQFYSVAIVSEKNVKWFTSAKEETFQ